MRQLISKSSIIVRLVKPAHLPAATFLPQLGHETWSSAMGGTWLPKTSTRPLPLGVGWGGGAASWLCCCRSATSNRSSCSKCMTWTAPRPARLLTSYSMPSLPARLGKGTDVSITKPKLTAPVLIALCTSRATSLMRSATSKPCQESPCSTCELERPL